LYWFSFKGKSTVTHARLSYTGFRHIKGLSGRIWWDMYMKIIEYMYRILECGSILYLWEDSYLYNNLGSSAPKYVPHYRYTLK
jgi:hypothetical protein